MLGTVASCKVSLWQQRASLGLRLGCFYCRPGLAHCSVANVQHDGRLMSIWRLAAGATQEADHCCGAGEASGLQCPCSELHQAAWPSLHGMLSELLMPGAACLPIMLVSAYVRRLGLCSVAGTWPCCPMLGCCSAGGQPCLCVHGRAHIR